MSQHLIFRINWQAFRKSRLRLSPAEQAFATKAITRWLPTGHRVEKYGGSATACHRCGEEETIDHLFQCNSQSKWKAEFIRKLDTFLQEIETADDIRRALNLGLMSWLYQTSASEATGTSASTQILMQFQSEIGWNLIFSGLFDEKWHDVQDQFFATKINRRSDDTGINWNVKLCSWVIREARQVWSTRNEEVHRPDDGNSKAEQAIYEQIRKLYDLRDEIGHQDRILLDEPIDEKLKRPFQVLQQWVRSTTPAINRCITDFQNKLKTGQRDIRQYFQRNQPIPQLVVNPTESESTIPE